MRSTTKRIFIILAMAVPFFGWSQAITNVNTSSQNCQCDTINVSFAVTSPLNAGNQFKVELSTSAGAFPGTYIQINPLLGFKPFWDLNRGLEHTARWYKDQGWL